MRKAKPVPSWFKFVATLVLLWNFYGVVSYFLYVFLSPEVLAAWPTAGQLLGGLTDGLVVNAFMVAVFSGAAGALMLLFGSKLAMPLFVVSLLATIVQTLHVLIIGGLVQRLGPEALMLPGLVIVLDAYMIILTAQARNQGWVS
jgi:hypothetical protein